MAEEISTNSEKGPMSDQQVEYVEEADSKFVPVQRGQSSADAEVADFDWDFDVWTNLAALYASFFATVFNGFILPISLGFLNKAFPTEIGMIPWVATAPSVLTCVLSLFVGELSDIFGRRWFLIVACGLQVIGSIVASRANHVSVLIGGQVLNGAGVSLGYLAIPLLAECVPKRSRALVLGASTAITGVITSGGGIAQGAFVKFHVGGLEQGWRVGVYLGAAFAFIGLVLVIFFYHPSRRPNPESLTVAQRLANIDWVGIFLGSASLVLILVGLQYGGNPYPWGSARVLCFIIVGIVLLIVFAIWEAKFVKFGLFPKSLFTHRNYAVVLAIQGLEGLFITTMSAFMTQIILDLLTPDQILALTENLSFAMSIVIFSGVFAWILYVTKEAKWILQGALVINILGAGLMALLQPGINYAAWFFPSALIGASLGGMGLAVNVISSLCTPNQFIATAMAILQSVRGLGGSVGVVIFSQIYMTKLKAKLPVYVAEAAIEAGLPPTSAAQFVEAYLSGEADLIAAVPGISLAIVEAVPPAMSQAYADSWRYIWFGLLPFVGVCFFVGLWLLPTKEQMTQQVASPVEHRNRGNRREPADVVREKPVHDPGHNLEIHEKPLPA